jgi:hypothetical protein
MAKRNIHKVVLTVKFDRPISRAHAVMEVRDAIHGQFYCNMLIHGCGVPYPDSFKVRAVQSETSHHRMTMPRSRL